MTENNERTTGAEDRPYLRWTDFEGWLAEQTERQDEVGAIARFVIADLERGCWPDSNSIDSKYAWWGADKARERQLRAWRTHLAVPHDQPTKTFLAFEHAHREYVEADERNFEEVLVWLEEHGKSFSGFDDLV